MIEVLIALVILAVSLLALAGLMGVVTKNNSFGNHLTEATTLAQDKLEELRVSRWDTMSTDDTEPAIRSSSGISYKRSWKVTPISNLKTVEITVKWNNDANSIRMVSALSQPY